MIRKNIGCSFKPKRILCFLLAITVFASFSACSKAGDTDLQDNAPEKTVMPTEDTSYPETDTPSQAANILVAYFSATGTTEGIAERISAGSGGVLYEITPAQVIIRWHLQRGVVAIPGSSNPEHILENISVFDFALSNSEMNKIAALDRNEKRDWY